MSKEKSVQIPQVLFMQIWDFFINDEEKYRDDIKKGLFAKVDKIQAHREYTEKIIKERDKKTY